MNRLSTEKRVLILRCLVEGCGVRGTARTAAVSKNTVQKLLLEAGRVCEEYQDETLRNLPCRHIQVDELWSYLYAKERNLETAKAAPPGSGDLWTWTAICADTKLVPSWRVGDRGMENAVEPFRDLRGRLADRAQVTTDGLAAYFEAVPYVFGEDVDFAAVVKLYDDRKPRGARRRPPGPRAHQHLLRGAAQPDDSRVDAALRAADDRVLAEAGDHTANLALFMYAYNFVRPQRSLSRKGGPPTTPAMAAGVADWPRRIDDVAAFS